MVQIVHTAPVGEKSTLQIVFMALVSEFSTMQIILMALVFSTQSPAYYRMAALRWAFEDCGQATYFLCVG